MSITHIASRIILSLALTVGTSHRDALCAEPPVPLDQSPSAPLVVSRAEAHFKRGVELYSEGNAEAAMVEFRRAYELAPRFQILYNMGQVAYALNDYAAAVKLFERYLDTGGAGVPEERRRAVTDDIERLRPRVGRIQVSSDVPGTRLAIDDVPMGLASSAPVAVNIGRRKVSVSTPDGRSGTQFLDVPAGETVVARFALKTIPTASPSLREEKSASAPRSEPAMDTGAIIAWAVAGGMLVGAAAAGAYALKRSNDLDDAKRSYPLKSDESLRELDDSVSRSTMLADGLLIGAAVSGAVGLWLTLSSDTEPAPPTVRRVTRSSFVPALSLTGISVQGQF